MKTKTIKQILTVFISYFLFSLSKHLLNKCYLGNIFILAPQKMCEIFPNTVEKEQNGPKCATTWRFFPP